MVEDSGVFGFQYYMVGTVPVAAALDESGWKVGTMVPDSKTRMLKIDMRFLSEVMEQGYDVRDIDQDEFEKACEAIYGRQEGA